MDELKIYKDASLLLTITQAAGSAAHVFETLAIPATNQKQGILEITFHATNNPVVYLEDLKIYRRG